MTSKLSEKQQEELRRAGQGNLGWVMANNCPACGYLCNIGRYAQDETALCCELCPGPASHEGARQAGMSNRFGRSTFEMNAASFLAEERAAAPIHRPAAFDIRTIGV